MGDKPGKRGVMKAWGKTKLQAGCGGQLCQILDKQVGLEESSCSQRVSVQGTRKVSSHIREYCNSGRRGTRGQCRGLLPGL